MARVRFGLFEFDLSTRELRRAGALLHLQSQPAQLLACLIQNAGRVVSREELRQAIWGSATFVDFDRGLNFCVTQIRSALADDATSPTYIRTIPKGGYQLIAPVEALPALAGAEAANPTSTRSWRPIMATGLVALIATVAVVVGYALGSRAKPTAPPVVAVVRLDNETGNPGFSRVSDAITDNLVERLTALSGGHYAVAGNASILRLSRDQRDLNAVGSTLHAKYVVVCQLQSAGNQTRLLAHLIRLPEQTHIWVARIENTGASSEPEIAQNVADALVPRLAADIAGGFSSRGLGR